MLDVTAGSFLHLHLGSVQVIDVVSGSPDLHGALISVKRDERTIFVTSWMTAAALPVNPLVSEIINGGTRIRCLLIIVEMIASPVIGDGERVVHLKAPASEIEGMDSIVAEF